MTLFSAPVAPRRLALALILFATACNGSGPEVSNEAASVPAATPTADAVLPAPEATATATPAPEPSPSSAGTPELSQTQVEAQYSPAFDRCLNTGDAAKGVTPAMAACVQAELQVQDDRLNAAYKSAMDKRGPAEQARLRTEERAWIQRRDAECQKQATGGTLDRIEIPMCLLQETIRRRVVLQPMAG
ncbi:lysozyme inhibitor LprI family protein [Sphingomonas sp. ac-8]|uniref:lysozyme inhibitor LprI family protein n=1 Tax=Sphingomonas sp. ac-8 TaxID=3242977 RepID=UPI003A8010D0